MNELKDDRIKRRNRQIHTYRQQEFSQKLKKHINGKSARISESLSTNRIKEVFIEHSIQQTEHKIFSSMQRTYEKQFVNGW